MARRIVLGPASAIPLGEGRNFDVDGREIAVFRSRSGAVFASQARCPHRQGPLADGLVGRTSVICPLHEWQFDLTTGETKNGACGVVIYSVTEDSNGDLAVELPT